jgi:hypothetical protein
MTIYCLWKFPQGRLLSQFIIDLATPLLSLRSGSVSEMGYPKGLIALIMAAVGAFKYFWQYLTV